MPLRPHNLICLALAAALVSGCAGRRETKTGLFTIHAGKAALDVEVASDATARAKGLSGRNELPEGRGMLFIFPQPEVVRFWMKDTRIPLSIAFITKDGKIADIQDMTPESLEAHSPGVPVVMALEANSGWFARNGVAVGDIVRLPSSILSIQAK